MKEAHLAAGSPRSRWSYFSAKFQPIQRLRCKNTSSNGFSCLRGGFKKSAVEGGFMIRDGQEHICSGCYGIIAPHDPEAYQVDNFYFHSRSHENMHFSR